MKLAAFLLAGLCLPLLAAVAQEPAATPDRPGTFSADPAGHLSAEIETTKGVIEVELDFQSAPLTTMNFVGLAEGTLPAWNRPLGQPFYDGTTFHRVVKGFVVQGGDPASADPATPPERLGEGGPGYSFPDEFSPGLRHDMAGVLSMANDGPDTNGSQFFITLAETNRLNYLHSVFGQVVRGMDVVNRIEAGDRIVHVGIKRVGRLAERFHADALAFAKLRERVLTLRRVIPAGFIYFSDDTRQLPDFRVKNFNYKLANYEHATGHRLAVRLEPDFAPTGPDQTRGNFVKAIANELGLPDTGDNALAVGFAKPAAWTTWLGEATYPALLGEVGSTEQLMASGVLHDRKAVLAARAEALLHDGKPKESVDAMIDTLILTLDDHALHQQKAAK